MKRTAPIENAEGVLEISPGLSRPATLPRVTRPHVSRTLKGCEDGVGFAPRGFLAPLQGAANVWAVVLGYRCAQPQANFRHPFRMLQARGGAR